MIMVLLAVETATSTQSVAVLRDEAVLGESRSQVDGCHTQHLISAIHALLEQSGCTLSQIDGLAVSIGPGSFTGLRVGLATVLGFRMVLQCPLVAVPTLEALAWNLQGECSDIYPVLTAGAGDVYWACFRWETGRLARLCEDSLGSIDDVAAAIRKPSMLIGEGWQMHSADLQARLGTLVLHVPVSLSAPSAVSVARAGKQMLEQGQVTGEWVTPRYIHPSYAAKTGTMKAGA